MDRRRLSIIVAALALSITAGCGGGGGGGDGTDKKPKEVKPLTIEDFKTSPDQTAAVFDAPAELDVPDPSWDALVASLASSLAGIIRVSFTDPNVWQSTSDERTYRLVFGQYRALSARADGFAGDMFDAARAGREKKARIGYPAGSMFPDDAQPEDSFIYKVAWQTKVEADLLTVHAVVWGGYDTGGVQPVMIAREFALTARQAGGSSVSYSAKQPGWGGYFDQCRAVVDGVLVSSDDRISAGSVKAYRKEFADDRFRSLKEAFSAVAKAGGSKASAAKSREKARECLADAGKSKTP